MLSALDLARRIEAGEVTPASVIERAAEAIAARETEVGAFAALDLDAARKAAAIGALKGSPLRGLPAGFKDIFDTRDFPTAYGSAIYEGYRPAGDAALVAMIRRAGGVALGKTVTTEFAHLDPGKTRNPHNPAHTPGGSSSGSAAGVAAGFLALATGSQTGGSVIRPASFCGVAGYKPSFALLPTVGMKCVSWHLDTAGLFAAGVEDVAFVAEAISGRPLRVDEGHDGAPRIAILRRQPWPDASADMTAAVETAARAAERAGATISDIVLPPIFAEAFEAHGTIQAYEAARSLAFEYDRHRDRLRPSLRTLVEAGDAIPHEAYDAARRIVEPGTEGGARPVRRHRHDHVAVRARRRSARTFLHRIVHVQPALDADGHPLRKHPGLARSVRIATRRSGHRPLRRRPRDACRRPIHRGRHCDHDRTGSRLKRPLKL